MSRSFHIVFGFFVLAFCLVGISVGPGPHVARSASAALAAPTPEDKPGFFPYRGVSIGMGVEEARKVLGAPKDKSNEMDLYIFSDNETAQVFYSAEQQVKAIAITFTGDLKSAPTPKLIFGEDVAPRSDGGIFKMVRYPKAGYWVSYNKTAGDDVVVSVAIQKM